MPGHAGENAGRQAGRWTSEWASTQAGMQYSRSPTAYQTIKHNSTGTSAAALIIRGCDEHCCCSIEGPMYIEGWRI
jgi:hypothetical protein